MPLCFLFDGTLLGSAFATVVYETNRFGSFDTRLGGYQFAINGVAATPEPATLATIVLGLGIAACGRRRSRRQPLAR